MVCSKCQKKLKSTELATPGVKRKSEMYYGSPSTSLGGGGSSGSGSAGAGSATAAAYRSKPTLGGTGVSKVRGLLYFFPRFLRCLREVIGWGILT